VRLDREAEEGILGVKRKIYKETMEVGTVDYAIEEMLSVEYKNG